MDPPKPHRRRQLGRPRHPTREEGESYILKVIQGTQVRRQATLYSPDWVYSAAMRQADNLQGDYRIEVAQLLARIGPGFRGSLSLTP